MTKLTKILIALLAILLATPMVVEAKNEKKKFEWQLPAELSGNETFDSYLLSCDTLWNDIQKYNESMTTYIFKTDTFSVNGQVYVMSHMENASGEFLTKSAANWQLVQAVTLGLSIVADGVSIGEKTVDAAKSMKKMGFLDALVWASYMKTGPIIIAMAGNEIKELAAIRRSQWQQWKAMKDGALDATSLGIWTPEQAKVLESCCFIKKYEGDTALISEEVAKQRAEQLAAQELTIAPEDEAQKLEEMPDDIDSLL